MIKANHDVNKGGFIISIAEMCFKNKLGADLDLNSYNDKNLRDDKLLFSESVGRFIIETDPKDFEEIMILSEKFKVTVKNLGVLINKPEINVKGLKSPDIKLDIDKMKELESNTLQKLGSYYVYSVDFNNAQIDGSTMDIMGFDELGNKFAAFGW